jgi:hypothetical protein
VIVVGARHATLTSAILPPRSEVSIMSRREVKCHDRRYMGYAGWDRRRGDYLYSMFDGEELISEGEGYSTAYALARDTWGLFDWLRSADVFKKLCHDPVAEDLAADGDPRMAELVAKSQEVRLKAS